ncbi:hypothetical protein PHSY_003262 [Pseudozyma hubeiensis SY62]|uniref:Uncharacterized protein n=1 Tax=Pseudozyma hubeiensis (strain SY62) TaxID=1305764 RepID=R9P2W5_PSEHS|nr:hypothetical protein PHSY_003262 [Pseudozyma hubeiensis SY62]GAC95686.1 hypothetical protein PHSY_003262 [Pseudozyma hubeiensis SY62]
MRKCASTHTKSETRYRRIRGISEVRLPFYVDLICTGATMLPSRSDRFPVTNVALFITATTPFSDKVIARICQRAEDASEASPDDDPIRLTVIPGNFARWTPLQLARDYVMLNLTPDDSPFACLSFVMLDEKSHDDNLVRIVAIRTECFQEQQKMPLEIEATMRVEPESAVDLPVLFHDGIQGIYSYPNDPYVDDAEQAE